MQAKNSYYESIEDGKPCIRFITGGKQKFEVIVDVETWVNYLHKYHWTAYKDGNYRRVQTSINKHTTFLHRLIVRNEYTELDFWGMDIDHINNNPLDNRLCNLRIYNPKLNASNQKSKFEENNMRYIHRQPSGSFKVHTNIFDETIYETFPTLQGATKYRDTVVIPYIKKRISDMEKRARDIEFERGLRDKLKSGEKDEILYILKRYGVL